MTYTTRIEVSTATTEWVGVDHRFTVGDKVREVPPSDSVITYPIEVILEVVQANNGRGLSYVMRRQTGRSYRRGTGHVDKSYRLVDIQPEVVQTGMSDRPIMVVPREVMQHSAMQFRNDNAKAFLAWADKAFRVSSTPTYVWDDDGKIVDGHVWLGRRGDDSDTRVYLNGWVVSTSWGPRCMSEITFNQQYKEAGT